MRWEPAEVAAVRELLDAIDGLALDADIAGPAAFDRLTLARAAVDQVLPPDVHVRHPDGTVDPCTVESTGLPGHWRVVAPSYLVTGDALVVDRAGAYSLEWFE